MQETVYNMSWVMNIFENEDSSITKNERQSTPPPPHKNGKNCTLTHFKPFLELS